VIQAKRPDQPPLLLHHCPVCHQPQTKIRRRLTDTTHGSTIYVCTRTGECSVAMNLSKVETWEAV
jgi:hypothetical protein